MELFDKKFVHFVWEDDLKGKKGFFADDGYALCKRVNCNDTCFYGVVLKLDNIEFPFEMRKTDAPYRFFYYDPNYEVKKAYMEGKQIQYRVPSDAKWYDADESDIADIKRMGLRWFDDDCEYRVKLESGRMTYRQLAEWVAKGNGQIKVSNKIHAWFDYLYNSDDNEVPSFYKIRKWGSDEWIEPTIDVYNDVFVTKG